MPRRYQRGSEMCEKLAKALDHLTNSEDRELFDFGRRAGEASPLVRMPCIRRSEDIRWVGIGQCGLGCAWSAVAVMIDMQHDRRRVKLSQ